VVAYYITKITQVYQGPSIINTIIKILNKNKAHNDLALKWLKNQSAEKPTIKDILNGMVIIDSHTNDQNPDTLDLLLKAGADAHIKSTIPLKNACLRGNLNKIKTLLENDANVDPFLFPCTITGSAFSGPREGKTSYTKQETGKAIIELLLKHGIQPPTYMPNLVQSFSFIRPRKRKELVQLFSQAISHDSQESAVKKRKIEE